MPASRSIQPTVRLDHSPTPRAGNATSATRPQRGSTPAASRTVDLSDAPPSGSRGRKARKSPSPKRPRSGSGSGSASGGPPQGEPLLRGVLRPWFLAALLVLSLGWGVAAWNVARPLAAGDAGEYLTQLTSWRQHGTPDLRPADARAVADLAARYGYGNSDPEWGYFVSPRNGRKYSWHFPAYSAAVTPIRVLLDKAGANGFAAFGIFNALLFFGTFIAATGVARAKNTPYPLALWMLCAGSPMLWYLRWPTPEVWTWAALFGAVLCLDARRYAAGALLAALGAWQNAPLLFVAWWFVALALLDKPRHWRRVAPVAAAASLSFLPNIFYLWLFGKSNLIFSKAYALDFSLVSPARLGSFVLDLNQGMLPYVPALLALAAWAVLRAGAKKPVDGLAWAAAAVLLLMVAACCLNAHWNVGEAGMRRYAAWMLPLWVWLGLRKLDLSRWRPVLLGALVWQLAVVCTHDGSTFFRGHTPWAKWVLTHAPALYRPDPVVFVERSPRHGVAPDKAAPVAFVDGSGNVTKLLLSRAAVPALQEQFLVNPGWLKQQERLLPATRAVLVDPPRFAVRARPATAQLYADWSRRYDNW